MRSFISRAGRRPLALAPTALAVLAACADEPTATQPTVPASAQQQQQLGTGPVFTVTNTSGSANVMGSLLWTVNQITGEAVIRFDPALAGQTITPDQTVRLEEFVTIEGPADRGLTISGNDVRPVLDLRAGGTVRNLTLTKGEETVGSGVHGGTGPLRLEHTAVVGNRGTAVYGRDVTLVNSTVSNNVAISSTSAASGIAYNTAGKLTLINSTVAHNSGAPGIGAHGVPGPIPTVVLKNSIVTYNWPKNCSDVLGFQYQGLNLSDETSCGNWGNIVVLDPSQLQQQPCGLVHLAFGWSVLRDRRNELASRVARALGAHLVVEYTGVHADRWQAGHLRWLARGFAAHVRLVVWDATGGAWGRAGYVRTGSYPARVARVYFA